MEAGSDPVAIFLQSFIFCLAAFPEVQVRAREELDKVVGRDRSPRFEDFKNLPYCDAIIKEASVPTFDTDLYAHQCINYRSTDSALLRPRESPISRPQMKSYVAGSHCSVSGYSYETFTD